MRHFQSSEDNDFRNFSVFTQGEQTFHSEHQRHSNSTMSCQQSAWERQKDVVKKRSQMAVV